MFPSLVAGNYYLEVDRATLGIGNLPMIKVPMAVTIEEHQKKQLDIEVVKAGSLRGRIAVFGPKEDGMLKNGTLNGNGNHGNGGDNGSNNGEPEIVEKSAWAGITVMIKNGGETFYAVSDKNGYFSFDELLPKTWTLSILSDLPALHYLEQKTITVTLEPGQKLELPVWRVLPIQREMILLEEEEL
ncbi:MAG TPA: carboxypeptidase-like regulatory domain-containing protein [Spirochaetales bacterium]|nr:carboxypeptidase-like regulatory domain-containing protein [Spirochaetales bacterium]